MVNSSKNKTRSKNTDERKGKKEKGKCRNTGKGKETIECSNEGIGSKTIEYNNIGKSILYSYFVKAYLFIFYIYVYIVKVFFVSAHAGK